jgi:hypothetical protein
LKGNCHGKKGQTLKAWKKTPDYLCYPFDEPDMAEFVVCGDHYLDCVVGGTLFRVIFPTPQ